MLKRNILWAVSVLCLTLASCVKNTVEVRNGTGEYVTISAASVEDNKTRTALNGLSVEWIEGDRISVFADAAGAVNVAHTAADSGTSTTFDSRITWGTELHDFYAYYPHTDGNFAHGAVPVSVPGTQTQSEGGNSDHIGALDFMVATPLTGVTPGGSVSLRFNHVFSIIEFKVLADGGELSSIQMSANAPLSFNGTINISQSTPATGTSYTLSGSGENSVALIVENSSTLTNDLATTPSFYMIVNPANLTGETIVLRSMIDGEWETSTVNGTNIQRGHKYTITVNNGPAVEDVLNDIEDDGFLAFAASMISSGGWDTDANGHLSYEEAAAVTQINFTNWEGSDIASLDLTAFTGLTHLYASGIGLTEIDLSENTELYWLDVSNNQLGEIDITGQDENTLMIFDCSGNPGIDNTFFVYGWFDNSEIPGYYWQDTGENTFTQDYMWVYNNQEYVYPVFTYGYNISKNAGVTFSTDYSEDYMNNGEMMWLNEATVANPIDVLVLGDGFTDEDLADGLFEDAAYLLADSFFAREPYSSFQNAFNIFALPVVSPNGVDGSGVTPTTSFSSYFADRGTSTSVGGIDAKTFDYFHTMMAYEFGLTQAQAQARLDRALIVVLMNTSEWAGTCWMYYPSANGDQGDGTSVSYFPSEVYNMYDPYNSDYWFECMLAHETNGHGFAKLADEYVNDENENATIPAADVNNIITIYNDYGWSKNIDVTSNRNQIKWKNFLSLPAYTSNSLGDEERIGIFEGANYYGRGVYRATEISPMVDNQGAFNAPSREAIYYRINKLVNGSGWTYNFNDFVNWDQRNMTRAAIQTRSADYEKWAKATSQIMPQAPAQIVRETSREVYEKSYGKRSNEQSPQTRGTVTNGKLQKRSGQNTGSKIREHGADIVRD